MSRENDQKWSGEIFKITKRYLRGGLPVYQIRDFHDNDFKGTFYQHELQRITTKDDQLWKVDKVLQTRKRKGKTEHLIRWLHWPKDFDTWEPESNI